MWINEFENTREPQKLTQMYRALPQHVLANKNKFNLQLMMKNLRRDVLSDNTELHIEVLNFILVTLSNSILLQDNEDTERLLSKVLLNSNWENVDVRIKTFLCLTQLRMNSKDIEEKIHVIAGFLKDCIKDDSLLDSIKFFSHLLENHSAVFFPKLAPWFATFSKVFLSDNEEVQRICLDIFETNRDHFAQSPVPVLNSVLTSLAIDNIHKPLTDLFTKSHEVYVLKIIGHLITIFGEEHHTNRTLINQLLPIFQKGYLSSKPEIFLAAIDMWKNLIDNFALSDVVLLSQKKIKLILNPLLKDCVPCRQFLKAKLETWFYFFSAIGKTKNEIPIEMVLPLIKFTFSQVTVATRSGKNNIAEEDEDFIKQLGCEILIHIITSFETHENNRSLKDHQFELYPFKGTCALPIKDMQTLLDKVSLAVQYLALNKKPDHAPLLQHMLQRIVSCILSCSKLRESDAVIKLFEFLTLDLMENIPQNIALNILEELANLPRPVLMSSEYQFGIQKIAPCIKLLRLFVVHYKTFGCKELEMKGFTTLVKAGLSSSYQPLKFTTTLSVMILDIGANYKCFNIMWTILIRELTQCNASSFKEEYSNDLLLLTFPFKTFLKEDNEEVFDTLHLFLVSWKKLFAIVSKTDPTNQLLGDVCKQLDQYVTEERLKCFKWFSLMLDILTFLKENINFAVYKAEAGAGLLNSSPFGSMSGFITLVLRHMRTFHFFIDKGNEKSSNLARFMDFYSKFIKSILSNFKISIFIVFFEWATPALLPFLASKNKAYTSPPISTKMEHLWSNILTQIEKSSHEITFDNDFLKLMEPFIEALLQYNKKAISEKATHFWQKTFNKNVSSLDLSQSLKDRLIVLKLLLPLPIPADKDESAIFPSASTKSSLPESSVLSTPTSLNKNPEPKKYLESPKTPASTSRRKRLFNRPDSLVFTSPARPKDKEDFVFIATPPKKPRILTDHQKEKLREKSFVPALYNELSQDTQDISNTDSSQSSQGALSQGLPVSVAETAYTELISNPSAVASVEEDCNKKGDLLEEEMEVEEKEEENVSRKGRTRKKTEKMVDFSGKKGGLKRKRTSLNFIEPATKKSCPSPKEPEEIPLWSDDSENVKAKITDDTPKALTKPTNIFNDPEGKENKVPETINIVELSTASDSITTFPAQPLLDSSPKKSSGSLPNSSMHTPPRVEPISRSRGLDLKKLLATPPRTRGNLFKPHLVSPHPLTLDNFKPSIPDIHAVPTHSILKKTPWINLKSNRRVHFSGKDDVLEIEGLQHARKVPGKKSPEKNSPPKEECTIKDTDIVFPNLKLCPDSVDLILPNITSSHSRSRSLKSVLLGRSITTIGQLSSLTYKELNKLPTIVSDYNKINKSFSQYYVKSIAQFPKPKETSNNQPKLVGFGSKLDSNEEETTEALLDGVPSSNSTPKTYQSVLAPLEKVLSITLGSEIANNDTDVEVAETNEDGETSVADKDEDIIKDKETSIPTENKEISIHNIDKETRTADNAEEIAASSIKESEVLLDTPASISNEDLQVLEDSETRKNNIEATLADAEKQGQDISSVQVADNSNTVKPQEANVQAEEMDAETLVQKSISQLMSVFPQLERSSQYELMSSVIKCQEFMLKHMQNTEPK